MDSWAYFRCGIGYFPLFDGNYFWHRVYSSAFIPAISCIVTIFFDSFGKYYSRDRTDSDGTRTGIVRYSYFLGIVFGKVNKIVYTFSRVSFLGCMFFCCNYNFLISLTMPCIATSESGSSNKIEVSLSRPQFLLRSSGVIFIAFFIIWFIDPYLGSVVTDFLLGIMPQNPLDALRFLETADVIN